jgi:UDP-N-acetylmuramoyl-L-alanyl-D-glutamate--2,6-diaminopimelate ligase
MMRLDALLEGLAPASPRAIAGLTLDSRRVVRGGAFVALPGARTHGLAHAAQASAQGAACVLFEPPAPADIELPDNAIAVPHLRERLGELADRFFASPSLSMPVIGVTGTNGKTSTVQLLGQALTRAGTPAGTVGTLGAGLFGKLEAGERTTPDVIEVHAQLARMHREGAQAVAMEVSSHALDQGRVDGVRFQVAVFTNLTRDHLDYHGDMQSYGEAKARLFAWAGLRAAVINLDDAFGATLQARVAADVDVFGVSSRGAAKARIKAENIELSGIGLRFRLVEGDASVDVRSRLLGRFNIDNLLAVAATLRALGWTLEQAGAAIETLDPVPGRMNRLGGDTKEPLVVIDYAHTPDALEQALSSLREHTEGKLVCVFGCGGERDRGKRPQMAEIAERLADAVIVTDDNPRNEDSDAIVAEIVAGFANPRAVAVERDRARAIVLAVENAQPGDVVLIAGKGHEPYQEIAGVKHLFDDAVHAANALAARKDRA